MKKRFTLLVTGALVGAVFPFTIWAQDGIGDPAQQGLALWPILSTLIYGLIGILLYGVGYLVFDKFLKLDLRKELVIDQNEAIGVMMAGVFIGIAIIIMAAMR